MAADMRGHKNIKGSDRSETSVQHFLCGANTLYYEVNVYYCFIRYTIKINFLVINIFAVTFPTLILHTLKSILWNFEYVSNKKKTIPIYQYNIFRVIFPSLNLFEAIHKGRPKRGHREGGVLFNNLDVWVKKNKKHICFCEIKRY